MTLASSGSDKQTNHLRSSRATIAVLMAGIIHMALQSWAVIATGRLPLTKFRTFVNGDQLGYAAIVSNVMDGQVERFEPYTETGINTYPRMYFVVVGLVGRLLGLQTVTALNLATVTLQFVMVVLLASLIVGVSGRWWVALLAPLPFLSGPMAWISVDGWYLKIKSHAVLWGPYGVLAPGNAESAGLCLGVIALCMLGFAWLTPRRRRDRTALTVAALALIGAMANNHTYSFLMTVYLASGIFAILGLYGGRHLVLSVVSVVLLGAVYLLGPLVNSAVGQLPTLVFGLIPFLPGLVALAMSLPAIVIPGGLITAALASPQILTTVADIKRGDPFLTYRVASNVDLGAMSWQTLLSSALVLLPLISMVAIGLKRSHAGLVSAAGGVLVASFLLVSNDWWGANVEPYRFWIESFCLGSAVSLIGLVVLCSSRTSTSETARTGRSRRWSPVAVVVGLSIALFSAGLPDYFRWATNPAAQQTWDPSNSRMLAISRAASASDGRGLLLTDTCINPQTTKVTTGVPIAYYRLGMAWPKEREPIDVLTRERRHRVQLATLKKAGVSWIITDSACSPDWLLGVRGSLVAVARHDYTADTTTFEGGVNGSRPGSRSTVVLWRIVQ